MGKNKLMRFAEVEELPNVIQPDFNDVFHNQFNGKGKWNQHFGNTNPIVIELGCGKGEYTVGMARQNPGKNFIGIDIKGARIWRGAKTAHEDNLHNVTFIRTRIEFVKSVFAENEVDEIWITFPDPQLKKRRTKKRLTSTVFLNHYKNIIKPYGIVHLKTDNHMLFKYTRKVVQVNHLPLLTETQDLYNSNLVDDILNIRTFYEQGFLAQNLPIHYLKFQIPPHSQLIEPPDDEE